MRAHDEDQEDDLRGAEELAPDRAQHYLPRVGHVVHVWVAQFELPDYVARVGG